MATARRPQLADLARLRLPSQPAISPDGASVVYTMHSVASEADERRSALWRVAADGGEPTQLTFGTGDSSPAWAPDGTQLAFLRRPAEGGPAQLWLLPAGPGEPRQLTSLPGGAGPAVWSPDGSRIAFTALVDQGEQPDQPDHAPLVADRLRYKLDGQGWWRGRRRQLFVVDLADGEARQVTEGDWHAGTPAWSPDGGSLAFATSFRPEHDLSRRKSEAVVLDLGTGEPREVFAGHVAAVTWVPAGDALIVIGAAEVRVGHDQLLLVPLGEEAAGGVRQLAPELDRNVMPGGPGYPGGLPRFTTNGQILLFCARHHGCTQLYALDGDLTGPARLVAGGDGRVVAAPSVAGQTGRCAVTLAGPASFGEVALADPGSGAVTVLTDHSLPGVALIEPEERWFDAPDGTRVQGWLLRDSATRTPAPLLLDIHGGPHNAWNPVPNPGRFYWQLLAARGWAVLLVNPRGSDGYGEEFFTGAVGGWGVADEQDFLAPVEQLVAAGVADPDRLAVTGYSYGGFMTCWLTTRTDRFRAAVVGAPIADASSMIGTSDAGHVIAEYELTALPWRDPELLAGQSPYQRVGEVTAPTLLLHGAADDRCPPGQSEQWFAALRTRGVPSRLVLYPGGSHLFLANGRPSHAVDYCQRVVDWVTRHTGAAPRLAGDRWQRRLAELSNEFRVPGAVLGVRRGTDRTVVATGVTNVETTVPVTPETRFQIGSITKPLTATAALRLVDQGRLDLDKPVVNYLPELRLADRSATGQITLRHLLTHTSGIDGDLFHDFGRGDDCLARYVAALAEVPQLHAPGATLSYSNSGYAVVGRLIEVITGQVWDEALRELLLDPAGLTGVSTLPEQALLHRVAVGHVHEADEPLRRTEVWSLPRATAAFGGTPCATADDLLTFAGLHLDAGVTTGGGRLLSAELVAAMQAEQAPVPGGHQVADSWGLGWFRGPAGGSAMIGHNGSTLGQHAFLRLLPDHDLAVTLLTNGGFAADLHTVLIRELIEELTGVRLPDPVTPSPESASSEPATADLGRWAGVYQRTGVRYEVRGDQLVTVVDHRTPGLGRPPTELTLHPVDPAAGVYAVRLPGARTWQAVSFYQLPDGATYLHSGLRATPRVD
ncbi:serine hydrolase [Natronosporangium hydrolyticum]|uniref:Serine hydrolase n=1 Tax=Natronosporangium hydrolyticum TaxID=2811111 RepID=A0A895YAC3_9ACTN|nr:serine hydrolase [Natronosporangium hydrolyticum]QSB14697.1 serine hydrolase [Natronosporangium hydrolyticum]